MANYIVFDIETAPLPEEQILPLIPPFDESEVKVGNIKDPALIAEKIEKAKQKHRADFIDKSALHADTGRVIAIGYKTAEGFEVHSSKSPQGEKGLIENFWKVFSSACSGECHDDLIGHNIMDFDLPFLVQRSWALGIQIPHRLIIPTRGKYITWASNFIDTRNYFLLGKKEGRSSLDSISRFFGIGGKEESGKHFYKWMEEDEAKAIEYLRNDLILTEGIARKMGIIPANPDA